MINKITKTLNKTYSKYDVYKSYGYFRTHRNTFNQ